MTWFKKVFEQKDKLIKEFLGFEGISSYCWVRLWNFTKECSRSSMFHVVLLRGISVINPSYELALNWTRLAFNYKCVFAWLSLFSTRFLFFTPLSTLAYLILAGKCFNCMILVSETIFSVNRLKKLGFCLINLFINILKDQIREVAPAI